jgi:hypothetical protein
MVIMFSLGVAGCGDDCHEGESECDGAQIRTCDEGDIGGYTFRGQGECCAGSTCIDATSGSDRVAACSDSPSPDARCGMYGNVCADPTTLLECRYGYSRAVEACAGTCVDPGDGHAFCAQVATDARCAGVTPYGSTCSGSTLVHCNAGALLDETACAAACVDRGQGHAFCSTSTMPDPRCPAMIAWCDGNVAMMCTSGGFVDVETCVATETCMVATLPDGTVLSAFCNSPSRPNACAADQ